MKVETLFVIIVFIILVVVAVPVRSRQRSALFFQCFVETAITTL